MATPYDLSICIPTYNRPHEIRKTLQHLADIKDLAFEVIVSDNNQDDATTRVVQEFNDQFKKLSYIQQTRNIGPTANSLAALSLATAPFCYILSDDDRLTPAGMKNALEIMKENPSVVAAYGGLAYFDPETDNVFEHIAITNEDLIVSKKDLLSIFARFPSLWLPIIRTEAMKRFVFMDGFHFPHISVCAQLIQHGEVIILKDELYKHGQTIPRMEHEMTEPWYHDKERADYERYLAMADIDDLTSDAGTQITQLITLRSAEAYAQGAKFALMKQQYLLARHYYLRMKPYFAVQATQRLYEWEQKYLFHALLERIEKIFEANPALQEIVIELSEISALLGAFVLSDRFEHFPTMHTMSLNEIQTHDTQNHELLIATHYETIKQRSNSKMGHEFALMDLIANVRGTNSQVQVYGVDIPATSL